MENPETKLAYGVTMYTLVGVGRTDNYPLTHGNCFSVATRTDNKSPWNDSGSYKIVNFILENLEHLIEEKVIEWPIKIVVIDEQLRVAAVNDPRIPDEYYTTRFCEVCTPINLLPVPQRLRHLRDIDRGFRTEHGNGIVSMN